MIPHSLKPHDANVNSSSEDSYAMARRQMVEDIDVMAHGIHDMDAPPISGRVLSVMGKVPRHRFVPEEASCSAYYNHPLPIGHGQTISQPFIVALMTDLLAAGPQDSVLEVGTGSGYQTAILAEMAKQVYTMEIVESLAVRAEKILGELGYANVQVKAGNGHQGWLEHAPFDAIIVTAAANHVPQPLLDQLKPGGRMVIPVGESWSTQELFLILKDQEGMIHKKNILPVRFVPLTGGHLSK